LHCRKDGGVAPGGIETVPWSFCCHGPLVEDAIGSIGLGIEEGDVRDEKRDSER